MEALVFLVDAIAIVILVITSLHNDRRLPGEKMIGIFRFREMVDPPKPRRMPAAYLTRNAPKDGRP